MASNDEVDKIAPKLNGNKEGTFAYTTVKDRWPKIVTKLVDLLKTGIKDIVTDIGEEADGDVRSILEVLSKLRYLIMTDKPLENLIDNADDAMMWNGMLQELREHDMQLEQETVTWYRADWLFVECYLYRYIYSAVYSTVKMREFDYFQTNKRDSFTDHIGQIEESCAYLLPIIAEDAPVHETFGLATMIKMSLWGNRADMSLTGGDNLTLEQSSMNASAQRDKFILVDNIHELTARVLFPLLKRRGEQPANRRIDIVLDNAGVELVGDLLLAEYFISMGFADQVHLHGKSFPWFVSDVTRGDFNWTLEQLQINGESCSKIAERLKQRIADGQIIFENHRFWTYPHAYCDMKTVCPDLYEELQTSSLAIFKGDLNYRKLVGDRDWDLDTSFNTALRGFEPCPVFALRTLKAETVAGLGKEVINELIRQYDEDNSWMTSGEYAVCQLGGAAPPKN
ncbi:unnamed protein product [Caenorhabditis angaria]|uniref:Sugar phosphate phosphatase n=1 Tax=Caenorhabditis angaria TaxID=860376 RepID=A0A9P1N668_9PELO|nr:unnamed protein product [Caenorhabditis angaria]